MFSTKSKLGLIVFAFSLLMLIAGLTYLLYLNVVFPTLVPFHGGGERILLSKTENYTYQIPWSAYTRLHLTLQTNHTVKLHIDNEYICDCTNYDLIVEPGEQVFILLKSEAPVSGRFTAWQETPFEKQTLALALVIIGLFGIGIKITGKL